MVPGWRLPSEDPKAWTQGLVAGAVFAFLPMAMEMSGEAVGMLLWGPIFLLLLLLPIGSVVDILRTRRVASRRVTLLLGIPAMAVYASIIVKWFSETPLDEDLAQAILPLLALLLAAERLAAHGRLAWRDRALAAGVGMVATWPFTVFIPETQASLLGLAGWAVLLALLPLRLPASARVVAVLLAALPALALGVFLEAGLLRRGIEWAAFLGYAAASAWVLVARGRAARPTSAPEGGPSAIR